MQNGPPADFLYVTHDDTRSVHMSFSRQRCLLADSHQEEQCVTLPLPSAGAAAAIPTVDVPAAYVCLLADAQQMLQRCLSTPTAF